MTPAYYCHSEGGEIVPWPAEVPFDIADLHVEPQWPHLIAIGGLSVHALFFREGAPSTFRRWDALNGFTGILVLPTLP